MKAFQLKMVIKNSKPPIWRRIIVPAGITFSQLGLILNKAMGWCGYHMFEFEFYHQELRITEGMDDFDIGYGPWDYLEASTTYIREFLEDNDWFTYTYDLGDDWSHRVTVEKIMEDYPCNYPKIIKYKGNCPVEDCGGIYGYYECLEILQDETNPEYEQRRDWMEMQGYSEEFDLDEVNRELEEECFYIWGKGEHRIQQQLYEDIFNGKYGLRATKKDKNRDLELNVSGKHKLEKSLDMIVQKMQELQEFQQLQRQNKLLGKYTLKDIFNDFDKNDILDIAKEKGMKDVSSFRKDKLIRLLVTHMLRPEEMEKYFACLQDEQMEEMNRMIAQGGICEEKTGELLTDLYAAGYIGILSDGTVTIPEDVASAYRSLDSGQFRERRKRTSFFLKCLRIVGGIYGVIPVDVFLDMVNQHTKQKMTEEELREQMQAIPPEFQEFVMDDGKIYHKEFYPDAEGLLAVQEGKTFYFPSEKELHDYSLYGCLPKSAEALKFKSYLKKELGAMDDEAEMGCRLIQRIIMGGGAMDDIFDVLEGLGLMVDDERELESLVNAVGIFWNKTRMIENRGFTPEEMSRKELRKKIIEFQDIQKSKVYPNDPCPCGSGKKYKKCCGKNKK